MRVMVFDFVKVMIVVLRLVNFVFINVVCRGFRCLMIIVFERCMIIMVVVKIVRLIGVCVFEVVVILIRYSVF